MKKEVTTIAIVDDNETTSDLLFDRIAEEADFECISIYNSSEEAVKELPERSVDIVLMDINMPEINGIECVTQLKPQMPDTDFVMLTVYEDPDHIFQAMAAGAVGYLLKRSAGSKLIDALRETVAGGSPMDSFIARKVFQYFQTAEEKKNDQLEALSPRETQVLELLAKGFPFKQIADQLNITYSSVDTYARRIYEKLHVNSRSEAVAKMRGIK